MPDPMNSLVGALVIGVPAYVALWLILRKQARAIFYFGVVLLAVGVGYLSATGATADIGKRVMSMTMGATKPSTPAPAPAR
jgi:hypothetical protein